MSYTVKEIFYTLQGEGAQAGRAAVFCRFAGCNLWSGREEDRATAICKFCDTDFIGTGPDGGKFATAEELAERIAQCWGSDSAPTSQKRDVGHPAWSILGSPTKNNRQRQVGRLHSFQHPRSGDSGTA